VATAKLKKRKSHNPAAITKTQPAANAPPQQKRLLLAEHLHRIGVLGKRIDAYIHFMVTINEHAGLSDEIKTRAAIDFHENLVIVEQQLGRIHDAYQLE
jgi:hypothetical protein